MERSSRWRSSGRISPIGAGSPKGAFHLSVDYRPFWVGWGQPGLYLLTLVTLSFYVRRRIGHATWRRIHYLSFVVFLMVTVHGLMSGTDAARAGVRVMHQTAGWSVLGLGIYRALAVWVFPALRKWTSALFRKGSALSNE